MSKIFSNNKIKLLLTFFAIFLSNIITVNIYYVFFKQENISIPLDPVFSTINTFSLFIFFIAALWEEFLFRYYLPFKNKFGAIWLVLITHYTVFKFFLDGSNNTIYMLISLPLSFCALYLISGFDKSAVYNLIFLNTKFKVYLSALFFSVVHLTNYNIKISNFLYPLVYVLILHLPFTLFLSHIRLNYKHGFWIATWFHFANNILATVLSLIFG